MNQNKYYYWYMNIIKNAQSQQRVKQFETHEIHHIIPESLGGTNDASNKIVLTYKEHYVCHHLLTKFTTGKDRSKMIFAFWNMSNKWGRTHAEYKINSSTYALLKKEVAELISKNNTGKSYPVSDATRKLLSESMMGDKNSMHGRPANNRGIKRPGIGGRKKGTVWSDVERQTHAATREQPGYYDYLKDPARGAKISDSLKGKPGIATGKHWFNDGITETYAVTCPAGYISGRLPRPQTGKRNMKWYNNGMINKQFRDDAIEQGFIRGRISKK